MSAVVEGFRETNRRLRHLLDAVAPEHAEPVAATPDQFAAFLSELLLAGEWLQQRPSDKSDPLLERELAEYGKNVERLQSALPALQAHLLAERARLEAERKQLEAATAWARAARKTT